MSGDVDFRSLPREKQKMKPTTREYQRRSGSKRFNFNPNYYPGKKGRDPLTKYMPPGMSYPNPKLANNAHNVPIFGNWAAHTMKRRVVDPIHGEKFIYPNEYDFKAGFGEMIF